MAQNKRGEQAGLRDFSARLAEAAENLPRLTVATGESAFLRADAVARFRAAWRARFPGGDETTLRGAGEAKPATLADVTSELSGGSLFGGDKLVVVRAAERLLFPTGASANGSAREQAFLARAEAPPERVWLLLETAELPKNRVLGKALAASAFVVPCPRAQPRELPRFLSEKAAESGRRLDAEAADMLLRAHGTDVGVLVAELEKVSLFAPEGAAITAETVGEFLTGTVEFDIFNFTNAVEAKDRAEALRYARRISSQGTRDARGKREGGDASAHRILFMLSSSVEALLRARTAQAAGADAGAFAARSKMPPWRAERIYASARRFSLRELRRMMEFAAEQMRRSHDTGGDAALSLELAAVRLTGGFAEEEVG